MAGRPGSETRHRTPDKAKFRKEVVDGDDWNHDRDKFVDKYRTIDKDGDRYIEKVVDPDTGEVLHDVDEQLSGHEGHGSDKAQKTPD